MGLFSFLRDRRHLAARWNVRLDSDDFTDRDRGKFISWVQDRDNAREYSAQRSVMEWSRDLTPEQKAQLEQMVHPRRGLPRIPDEDRRRSLLPHFAAVAAGLAVLVVGGMLWLGREPAERNYVTDVGETLKAALPDGSTTELNTRTHLTWMGSRSARHVQLHNGEAFFEVKPDRAHPFEIQLKRSRITVVGTRFNVYEKANGDVRVTVLEGIVLVQGEGDAGSWRERLLAHEEMEYTLHGHRIVRIIKPRTTVDWQEGKFSSEGIPLARVVEELSRYTRSHIRIEDPVLANVSVGGVFSIRDVPLALQRVASAADVPMDLVRTEEGFTFVRHVAPPVVTPPTFIKPPGKVTL